MDGKARPREAYTVERGGGDSHEIVAVFERLEDAHAAVADGLGDWAFPIPFVAAGEPWPTVVTVWTARALSSDEGSMEVRAERMPAGDNYDPGEVLEEGGAVSDGVVFARSRDRETAIASVLRRAGHWFPGGAPTETTG